MEQGHYEDVIGAQDDLSGTGDNVLRAAAAPFEVVGFGYIADAAVDNTPTTLNLALDKRPTIGSDASRAEVEAFEDTVDRAAGDVVYHALAEPEEFTAGQEAVVEVVGAAVSGTGQPFIRIRHRPFHPASDTRIKEV